MIDTSLLRPRVAKALFPRIFQRRSDNAVVVFMRDEAMGLWVQNLLPCATGLGSILDHPEWWEEVVGAIIIKTGEQ